MGKRNYIPKSKNTYIKSLITSCLLNIIFTNLFPAIHTYSLIVSLLHI